MLIEHSNRWKPYENHEDDFYFIAMDFVDSSQFENRFGAEIFLTSRTSFFGGQQTEKILKFWKSESSRVKDVEEIQLRNDDWFKLTYSKESRKKDNLVFEFYNLNGNIHTSFRLFVYEALNLDEMASELECMAGTISLPFFKNTIEIDTMYSSGTSNDKYYRPMLIALSNPANGGKAEYKVGRSDSLKIEIPGMEDYPIFIRNERGVEISYADSKLGMFYLTPTEPTFYIEVWQNYGLDNVLMKRRKKGEIRLYRRNGLQIIGSKEFQTVNNH